LILLTGGRVGAVQLEGVGDWEEPNYMKQRESLSIYKSFNTNGSKIKGWKQEEKKIVFLKLTQL
jgi:hypothetical protein